MLEPPTERVAKFEPAPFLNPLPSFSSFNFYHHLRCPTLVLITDLSLVIGKYAIFFQPFSHTIPKVVPEDKARTVCYLLLNVH